MESLMNTISRGATRPSRTKINRFATAVAMAAAASMLLAGCSSAATGPNDVTIWYSLGDPTVENQKAWLSFNIDPFTEANPDLNVKTILNPQDTFEQKQKVALAAGAGPDIVTTPGSASAIPYATAGYFADLGDVAESDGWADQILPWALDMGYIDGKLEAVPLNYETMVLYYNTTVFEENGWEVPTDRASLVKLVGEMQDKGIIPFAAGNASYHGATEWLVSTYFNQVAGPSAFHDAIAGDASFTDPGLVASMQMMKDDFADGWYAGGVKQYFTTQDPQKYAQFADGEAAMMVSGSWEMPSFGDFFGVDGNTSDWAWAPLPPMADGVPSDIYPLSVGGTISVNAASKSSDASKSYLSWLFKDTATMWKAVAAGVSAPLPIKYSPEDVPSDVEPRYAAQYQAINDASEVGKVGYVTWTSFGSKSEAFVGENADKLINGDMSPEEFCAGIQTAFEEDRASGLVPSLFSTNG
jgi:raffinose/stachyose/melibiose transport system substrate-binding protein